MCLYRSTRFSSLTDHHLFYFFRKAGNIFYSLISLSCVLFSENRLKSYLKQLLCLLSLPVISDICDPTLEGTRFLSQRFPVITTNLPGSEPHIFEFPSEVQSYIDLICY